MLNEFLTYLQEQVDNGSIYVLGAQGQTGGDITEKWIKMREHNVAANYNRAIALWKSRIAAGYDGLRAFDCSGLGVYWLFDINHILDGDKNANGLMSMCTLIQKNHLKRGDWVFKVSGGRATHIGYVVDSDLNVIESQGRAYGVVKRPLSAGNWNTYGRPSWFAAEIDALGEREEHMAFNRNLKKGCKGDDVEALQVLLNAAGDNIVTDGDFGSRTQKAVKAFQKRKGLSVDGIAGRATITVLGGTWEADKPLAGNVTICTFNIKRGTYKRSTYKRIAEIVKGADIVGIQEVAPYGLGKIAGAAGKTSHMCETISGYGHGILSDYSVDSEEITTLGGSGERRKVHHQQIGDVSFYNTHFHYTESANDAQLKQFVQMLEADRSKVIIVTGDFNRQYFGLLTTAGFTQTNTGQAIRNTEGGSSIVNKIDQVFVRGALIADVWKYEAVKHKYSDHDALFVRVRL